MPRLNVNISKEAKAVFDAFKKETSLAQDEAANALLLEFAKLHEAPSGLVAVDASGNIVPGRGPVVGVELIRGDWDDDQCSP